MAKLIEFYVPGSFRSKSKWLAPALRGKLLDFRKPAVKAFSPQAPLGSTLIADILTSVLASAGVEVVDVLLMNTEKPPA